METVHHDDNMRVHTLDADEAEWAYDITQTHDEIRNGDVLVVPSEGVVGFLCDAWPVALIRPMEDVYPMGWHGLDWEGKHDVEHPVNTHEASILKCCEIAESDADITGNDHWVAQAASIRELIG